ncbi:MMPL family transporter [Actinomadura sp. 9N215]|uniref:MMPL family transporter n=1 Tax=Actinomadura sp. 9N215 TaxID=3375150 RepID=UPI0037B01A54
MKTLIARRPLTVIAVWIAVIAAGFVVGTGVFERMTDLTGTAPGSESSRTAEQLQRFEAASHTVTAVVAGRSVDDAPLRDSVERATQRVRQLDGVLGTSQTPAPDRRALAISVRIVRGDDDVSVAVAKRVAAQLRTIDAPTVRVGGGPLLGDETKAQAQKDLQKAETLSLPIVLVLLLVVFGGLLAAGLPLIVAIAGIGSTFLILYGISEITEVSVYAIQITTMLGLGLAVDYALLMVTRFREARATEPDVRAAVDKTMATAGRTVLFSGLTVAAGLAGLLVFSDPFLRSVGFTGAAVVGVDMLAALTLLPALLVRFGKRIRPARERRHQGRTFGTMARMVQRRPLAVMLVLAAGLLVIASPAAELHLSNGDARSLPAGAPSRQLFDEAVRHFGTAAVATPVTVVAQADPSSSQARQFQDRVRTLPGVVSVTGRSPRPGVTVLSVIPRVPAGQPAEDGSVARQVVRDVRDLPAPFPVTVTGAAAKIVDYQAMVGARLPWALLVSVIMTLALLFAFTGSVLLPVKAVLSNALSLGAALGLVVWIFQDGHLGVSGLGALDSTAPILIAAIAFGLSTDYEVFLLARIREEWRREGATPDSAVALGLQRSGRVVTCAALLLMVVFACFTLGGFSPIKQIGLGLTLAIALDATVVRMLIVPATMTVLGRRAWWAPPAMTRWHARHGLTESP